MFTSNQFQNLAILFWLGIGILAPPFVVADETKSKTDNIPQAVVNLDLCTLAYQLYHQSLSYPLDPWYDIMSRVGSDRRNNICRFTHDYAATLGTVTPTDNNPAQGFYSGPNKARGWRDSNLNLDPIITNYKQIDAQLPTFTRDGKSFLTLFAPAYVTNNIKMIEGVRYKSFPTYFPSNDVERFQIREYPSGEDHLIVFEGGTGVVGTSDPSWSLMGFVLMRKTPSGHDAHIVFRGSRSGSALGKTVLKAQEAIGDPKGNPDWITDLRGVKQCVQPRISKVGKLNRGFAEALPTMLGPITACCKHLEQNYPAPDHIYVTGHSLGAGLASQLVSGIVQGSFGDELRKEVKGWPWDKTTLMAYAQPIPGDLAWATNFNRISPTSQHYWVAGDVVVEATSKRFIGLVIDNGEHVGVQNELSKPDDCDDNAHEVFVIRAALLQELLAEHPQQRQKLGRETTWAYYETFTKMLAGQPDSYVFPGTQAQSIVTEHNLRQILQSGNFGSEFERWLEQVYAKMIAERSSYIGFKRRKVLDRRQRQVFKIVEQMRNLPLMDHSQELDSLVDDFKLIDGKLGLTDEEQWIYFGMILSKFQKTKLTLGALQSKAVIKECLESKFNHE